MSITPTDDANDLFDLIQVYAPEGPSREELLRREADLADKRFELADLDTECACTQGGPWLDWCLHRRFQVRQELAALLGDS